MPELLRRQGGQLSAIRSSAAIDFAFSSSDNEHEVVAVTIEVVLSPETEASLAAQAASHRMDLSAYAASLLESAAQSQVAKASSAANQSGRAGNGSKKSLPQLFAESPFRGLDLNFERDADLGRQIAL